MFNPKEVAHDTNLVYKLMTTEELLTKVSITPRGSGNYKVTIEHRGNYYTCISHDTLAWDDLGKKEMSSRAWYKTDKQALLAFWNECKRKNHLK